MKYITGYTKDTPYKEMIEECVEEFDRIDIKIDVIPFEDRGDWAINNHRKPQIINEEWDYTEPIAWIDGDIRPNPDFEKDCFHEELDWLTSDVARKADMICEYRPGQPPFQRYISGFMIWFPSGKGLLDTWCEYSERVLGLWEDGKHIKDEEPDKYVHGIDQETLTFSIEGGMSPNLILLPDGYNDRDCGNDSLWWHLPASRTMKEVINNE